MTVIRIAIINCSSDDPEELSYKGKRFNASELLAEHVREFASGRGAEIETKIYRPSGSLPLPDDFDAVIIPGSKYDIDEAGRRAHPWMERLLEFIRSAHSRGKPILGICFGHQAIGAAFGSKLGKMEEGKNLELGFVEIELTAEGKKDRIFSGVPERFDGMEFHFRFIEPAPVGSVVLAYGYHPRIIQAFRIGGTTWGVQFHPDYSPGNVKEIIDRREDWIRKYTDPSRAKLDPGRRHDDTVLYNFLSIICG